MLVQLLCLLAAPVKSVPISFLNDVEPILARAGCNSGTCHGMQFGKGGFKLSLFGFDPQLDYDAIVRQAGGRRVTLANPAESLLLRKPSLNLAHGGGLRIQRGSEDYRTLALWIQQGAPAPNPSDPHVIRIEPNPRRITAQPGASLQLHVYATYSAGTRRDVTAHTRISSLNDSIASATPEGNVTARAPGATAIMLRYAGQATAATIDVPYRKLLPAQRPAELPTQQPNDPTTQRPASLDRLVAKRWQQIGLTPSPLCTDTEFIRRAFVDIIGTLPTSAEVRSFLASSDSNKRDRLIDQLLDRPEYVDYWSLRWSDLLRNSGALGPKPMWALNGWIREQLRANTPFDVMVRQLLTANGRASAFGPANYFRVATTPQELTESTAQLFLGIRLQCARCHNHPFERWTQSDYYRFAALFARVSIKGKEPIVASAAAGEVTHPKTGQVMAATPPAIEDCPPFVDSNDRREALADWLTSPRNMQFSRTIVNRYWAALMGRGIVQPVDDMRITNPPSNPELLDSLARGFIASGFDLKKLIRQICTSRTYQLSSNATAGNRADDTFFSHHLTRRMPAEVMLDAVCQVTGVPEKFAGYPAGVRAIQLPDSAVGSPFLDTFGRPPRSSVCECERASEPSLPQALSLLNGESLQRKLAARGGRIDRLIESAKTDAAIVDELYTSAFARLPRASERRLALDSIRAGKDRRKAIEDLLWAILNTNEFMFVR